MEHVLALLGVVFVILLLSVIFIPKFTPLKELVLGVGGNVCPQSGKTDSDYIKDINRLWDVGNRNAAASLFIEYKGCFPHLVSSVSSDVRVFALNIEAERVNTDLQLELNTAISNLEIGRAHV